MVISPIAGVWEMLTKILKQLADDSRGATAVEYGLICALLVIACLTALKSFSEQTIAMWNRVSSVTGNAVSN